MKSLLALLLLLPLTMGAAAAPHRLIDNLSVVIEPSSLALGPVAIAERTQFLAMSLARQTSLRPTIWNDPAIIVSGEFHLSIDGGQTFNFLCAFAAAGGIDVRPDLTESPATTISCSMPAGKDRLMRAFINVSGGVLVTDVTVEEQN